MINEKRILQEFIELVSIPCASKNERAIAKVLVEKMQTMGLEVKIDSAGEKAGGTVGNVWGFLAGNIIDAPRLFFEAHMDSVEPTTGTKVVCKDDILYSDGTTTLGGDDKVGIVAALEAVRVIKEKNIPHGDIQLCFTIGEEIGCLGALHMDPSWIHADFGYCIDIGGTPGQVVTSAPGALKLHIKVQGKAAHAGLEPENGINAIMLAAKALVALPNYGRLDHETTLNVGKIEGGVVPNVVAPCAEFIIDMRCIDMSKLERLKTQTIDIIQKIIELEGGQVTVSVKKDGPSMFVDSQHQSVKLAQEAAENLKLAFSIESTGGCSDGNYLSGYGLPCVLLATGMSKVHTTGEYLKKNDLYNCARWVTEIIKVAGCK